MRGEGERENREGKTAHKVFLFFLLAADGGGQTLGQRPGGRHRARRSHGEGERGRGGGRSPSFAGGSETRIQHPGGGCQSGPDSGGHLGQGRGLAPRPGDPAGAEVATRPAGLAKRPVGRRQRSFPARRPPIAGFLSRNAALGVPGLLAPGVASAFARLIPGSARWKDAASSPSPRSVAAAGRAGATSSPPPPPLEIPRGSELEGSGCLQVWGKSRGTAAGLPGALNGKADPSVSGPVERWPPEPHRLWAGDFCLGPPRQRLEPGSGRFPPSPPELCLEARSERANP